MNASPLLQPHDCRSNTNSKRYRIEKIVSHHNTGITGGRRIHRYVVTVTRTGNYNNCNCEHKRKFQECSKLESHLSSKITSECRAVPLLSSRVLSLNHDFGLSTKNKCVLGS